MMSTTSDSSEPESNKVSKRFCAPDADVIFQSSDGIAFHIHRKNLEYTTGGFPPAETPTFTDSDPVSLPEESSTLELLFCFIYPARHPELDDIDFPTLAALAEAAEKYEVYSAMVVCKIRWSAKLGRHPIEALNYGTKHGYMDIVDKAAPYLIKFSLEDIAQGLSPNLAIPWMRYYSHWMDVLASVSVVQCGSLTGHLHLNPTGYGYKVAQCAAWAEIASTIVTRIGGKVASLADLQSIFDISTPMSCFLVQTHLAEWSREVQARLKKIPRFSTFL